MDSNETDALAVDFETVPYVLIGLMRITAILIVVLNTTVLLCLHTKPHNIPRIYTLQMSCLCLADIMVGVAVMVESFLDYDWFRGDIIRCCSAICFFISSQSATLYNVMAICLNRFIIMVRLDKVGHHLTRTRVIVFSASAFVLGFTICSLPFVRWTASQEDFGNAGCSMETAFRENMESAMKVLFATFLVPLVITNILYGSLVAILRNKQRRTRPQVTSKPPEPVRRRHSGMKSSRGTLITPLGNNVSKQFEHCPIAGPSLIDDIKETKSDRKTIGNFQPIDDQQKRQNGPTFIGNPPRNIAVFSLSNKRLQPSTHDPSQHPERHAHQRRAFALLGFILLFLNIFTWPGVTVLFMETIFDSWSLSRASKVPLFCTISFNSLVNPILYTIRVIEFRKVLASSFRMPRRRR